MSWIQTAKVGQRVVCINDDWRGGNGTVNRPKKNDILTIRRIYCYNGAVGFVFKELINPPVHAVVGFVEQMFMATQFKPLNESRLDIFRAMMMEKPQHANA